MRSQGRSPGMMRNVAAVCAALTLTAMTARAARTLYFGEVFYPSWGNGYIHSVGTDGTGLQTVVDTGGGFRDIAIDDTAEKMYWTDVDGDRIRRSDLDGSNIEDLITSGLSFPMGIDVDPAANLLCWGDALTNSVSTAHLDGSGVTVIASTPVGAGVALDTVQQKVYWTTAITSVVGEIRRANYDGSGVEVVVTGHDRPSCIALDIAGGKVYWADYVVDVVRRANLDGTGVEDLYVVGANQNPNGITLDLDAGKVYWGQDGVVNRSVVMRMNLDGTDPEDMGIGTFGIVAGLAVTEVSSSRVDERLPVTVAWGGSAPNPFGDQTLIRLALTEALPLRLAVYGVDGRRVATLVDRLVPAGGCQVTWDGTDDHGHRAPSGVYLCRVDAGAFHQAHRIVLSR